MEEEFKVRSVEVPAYRIGFFKANWIKIYTPLVESFDLQVRFNLQTKSVDLRSLTPKDLERCSHFITAIVYGFTVEDSLRILKNTDCFTEYFRIQDVKKLKNDHVNRAIGRIIGSKGKIKKAIESTSNTKIVLKDCDVYIMGNVENMRIARHAICRLIMGSEPGKVCSDMKGITLKIKDKLGMIENIRYFIE